MARDALGRRNRDTQVSPDRQMSNLSFFQPEGVIGAIIVEGVVTDLNMAIWTVDVVSKFDQKFYPNVQIGSPYQNPERGEGIYVMPDIGSKCHVCIPSDGPPPYVLDFIMPSESIEGTNEEPADATNSEESSSAKTFQGGRPRPKSGDIYIKGRDGNFVILHKGGVLQIGSTELAQRIYIPLENLITDISQNYRHYNTGGAINWFLAPGESKDNPYTVKKDTYRIRAADKEATIRVAIGSLRDPVSETISDVSSVMARESMGTKANPIYCEVTLAPEGFEADNGASKDNVKDLTVLRYFFDKAGNVLLRTQGSMAFYTNRNLSLRAKTSTEIISGTSMLLSSKGITVEAKDYLQITTNGMRVNSGKNPTAHVGSLVEVILDPTTPLMPMTPIPVLAGGAPVGAISPGTPMVFKSTILRGTVKTGQIKVLI
jgi:hypothetical protein